jgi:hypothetical protein
MGRILTVACIALLSLGCGSASKRAPPSPITRPGCGLAVVWHGVRYLGSTPAKTPIPGRRLGPGGVPRCADVLGGETGASLAVEVRTLVGVDPSVAVTVAGDRLHVYRPAARP